MIRQRPTRYTGLVQGSVSTHRPIWRTVRATQHQKRSFLLTKGRYLLMTNSSGEHDSVSWVSHPELPFRDKGLLNSSCSLLSMDVLHYKFAEGDR